MHVDVPADLADRVRYRGDVLVFRRAAAHPLAAAAWSMANVLDEPSILAYTRVEVSKKGVFVGLRRTAIPFEGQRVRLVGEPGRAANLFVNGAREPLLYTPVEPPGRGPWTTSQILWLGRTIGMLLGIPWRVEWDRAGWDQWNHDPILRGRIQVANLQATSERDLPDLFRYRLEEPPGSVALEAAVYTVRAQAFDRVMVRLERDQVRTRTWSVPWEAVHGVGVSFTARPTTGHTEGVLNVSYQDRVLRMVALEAVQPLEACYLRFLAQEIERRAKAYRPRAGSASDVPEPLRALRR